MNKKLLVFLLGLICWSSNLKAQSAYTDPWLGSPLSDYVTKDQWRQIVKDLDPFQGKTFKVHTLYINTGDYQACRKVQSALAQRPDWKMNRDLRSLCDQDPNYPWTSLTVVEPVPKNQMYDEVRVPVEIRPDQPGLAQETFNFGVMGVGFMGVLFALPESITKWDSNKSSDEVLAKWKRNLTSRPVVDKDDWAVNYIGHPVSGAAYYVVARHMNYSRLDSALYSFFMSTFFWEYGLEAVAERPSIQDLILTPVLGSLLGEAFYMGAKNIEANDGKVLGSKKLGSFSMFLLNPAGTISKGLNKMFDSEVVQSTETHFFMRRERDSLVTSGPTQTSTTVGLEFVFRFW